MTINGDILIIEDCDDIRELYIEQLRIDGFSGKVLAAKYPEEGMELFLKAYNDNKLPVIIILDVIFAGKHDLGTGYEIAKEIRKFDRRNECTIIAVTANSRCLDKKRILDKNGVDAIFYKSDDWTKLWANIKLTYEKKNEPIVEIVHTRQGGFLDLTHNEYARWAATLIFMFAICVWMGKIQSDVNHSSKDNTIFIQDFKHYAENMSIQIKGIEKEISEERDSRGTAFATVDSKINKVQGTIDAIKGR